MNNDITLKILGDYGPFSRMGKSIGYQIKIGQSSYLIDCGAPLFHLIGGHGLKEVKGLIVTHCHDDHKRWFTDLALFHQYAVDYTQKLLVITTEEVNDELKIASGPALQNSLSKCGKEVVDVAYEEYIDFQIIGPRAKYKIVSRDEGSGKTGLYVTDREGNVVSPDVAKIFLTKKTKMPRMLFKDPAYNEWIEPKNFYPFSSNIFYEKEQNILRDKEGFTIEAINASVWHGITGIGLKVKTSEEALIFSSDTAHDEELWEKLYTEKREQLLNMPKAKFDNASVIYGNINDHIERMWSQERYKEAINEYGNANVIHDMSIRNSIVHTDYERLNYASLKRDKVILTHSPDKITSEWALSEAGKTFNIKNNTFFEVVGEKHYPLNADIFHKQGGKCFVGYKNEEGNHAIYKNNGLLRLSNSKDTKLGTPLYRVDIYQDLSGKYYPKLEGNEYSYIERPDGKVDLFKFTDEGSIGKIVENHRCKFTTHYNKET